jgi:hypothetical protein
MNPFREQYLKDKEKAAKELFERIKDNPKPDIADLWSLTEDYFIEWRKLHDFPKLLSHFDKTLLLFKEWKSDNKLNDDILLKNGELTPFFEKKKLSKKKKLFLIEQTHENKTRTFVSYKKLEGEKQNFGEKFHFKVLLEFYSYLDWLEQRGKSENILNINSRTAPASDYESVSIHADVYSASKDFELLKMDGVDAPVNGFGILLRGKRLEFVNVCGLRLKGEINFGEEGNLSFSYCACDNMLAEQLKMPLLRFEHCSVTNFKIVDSKIQQWRFYDSQVSGDFENTQFRSVSIWGGYFNPVMKGCTIFDFDIEKDKSLPDKNLYAYKILKKMYADQGDDVNAIKYFIKEHNFLRLNSKGLNKISKTISFLYWGYGRKPLRILWVSLLTLCVFSAIYWINRDLIVLNNGTPIDLTVWDCIYFSSTTFTTLGYGDYSPTSYLRIIAVFESFFGVLNAGFLIAGLATNKY